MIKSVTISASSETPARLKAVNGRGQSIDIVFSPTQAGFSPLELLAGALASCLAASIRIAAKDQGIGRLGEVEVDVEATKAEGMPSRVASLSFSVRFGDDLDTVIKNRLVEAAEEICTISNTIRGGNSVEITYKS